MLHVMFVCQHLSIFVQIGIHRNSYSTRAMAHCSVAQDSKILLFQLPGPFGNLEPDTSWQHWNKVKLSSWIQGFSKFRFFFDLKLEWLCKHVLPCSLCVVNLSNTSCGCGCFNYIIHAVHRSIMIYHYHPSRSILSPVNSSRQGTGLHVVLCSCRSSPRYRPTVWLRWPPWCSRGATPSATRPWRRCVGAPSTVLVDGWTTKNGDFMGYQRGCYGVYNHQYDVWCVCVREIWGDHTTSFRQTKWMNQWLQWSSLVNW